MDRITIGFIAAGVLLLGLGAYGSIVEQREWDTFSVAHHCEVVGYKKGTVGVGTGVGSNGGVAMVTVSNPSQTAYSCDDGITYWR